MNFIEEQEYNYGITAKVPQGNVVLTAENMPEDVTIISLSKSLLWMPPAGSGVDPTNPSQGYRDYHATIVLESDKLPGNQLKKPVTLRVSPAKEDEDE